MTRRELMHRMGEDEFAEQVALDRIYPLADPYLAAGIVAAANASIWGATGKAADPETYRPTKVAKSKRKAAEATPRQSKAEMLGIFRRVVDGVEKRKTGGKK